MTKLPAALEFLPRLIRRLRGQSQVWIEAEALKTRLDGGEDLTVVDVRGPEEFTGTPGHIPDSRNIPVGDLPQRIEELRPLSGRAHCPCV